MLREQIVDEALVTQPSPLGGALAEEYNRLVADANDLIDALNWARW